MQREPTFQSESIIQNNFANQVQFRFDTLSISGGFFSETIVQAIALQTNNKGISKKVSAFLFSYFPVFILKVLVF